MFDEPYIRSFDGATMIAIAPGIYVNEAVWRVIGAFRCGNRWH